MMNIKFIKILNSRWNIMQNDCLWGVMHRTGQGYWAVLDRHMGGGMIGPCRMQKEVMEKLYDY